MTGISGEKLSRIAADIREEFGAVYMTERDYRFTQEEKVRIYGILMEQKALPHHPFEADPVHVCCEFERFLGNPAVWTVTS